MAYFSQEHKKELAPQVKAICKKYGITASLAVSNHSTFVLNIKGGDIDFIGNYNRVVGKRTHEEFRPRENNIDINVYWYQEQFDGKALEFLNEIIPAMKGPKYFNNDDVQTDYFSRSHYIDINVGSWIRHMLTPPELIESTMYFDFGEKYYHSPEPRIKSRYMHMTINNTPLSSQFVDQLRLKFSSHSMINALKYADGSVKYTWAKNRFKPMPLGELTEEDMEAFTLQALQSEKIT
ncbi:hypothetical protein GHT06_001860 [Daphnia sinensis]|uniref:Uncharacterized protein n=1 Tax=Daphnia sinensis TaxID=1820382 RepID=A0AAD5KSN3_9CRUS|nr:hypothetical protein GHT06_001860 [Daphnia sinensis]